RADVCGRCRSLAGAAHSAEGRRLKGRNSCGGGRRAGGRGSCHAPFLDRPMSLSAGAFKSQTQHGALATRSYVLDAARALGCPWFPPSVLSKSHAPTVRECCV